MATPSIVDEVKAMLPVAPGNRPWYERVAPEQHDLLQTILKAWRAGVFGKSRRRAARAIAAVLTKHGIRIGEQGVDTWLVRQAT